MGMMGGGGGVMALGQQLMGKRQGDLLRVDLGGTKDELRIVSVS